jgi:hypothetical protein
MKTRKNILTILFFTLAIVNLSAQSPALDNKYRRSTLQMVLIESENFPNKETVINSWNKAPFPDKYNKHGAPFTSINIADINPTDDDLLKAGFLKDTVKGKVEILIAETAKKSLRYLDEKQTLAIILPNEKQLYKIKLDKYIESNDIAKKVVSKWFNMNDKGKFNMQLIQERGLYNASEIEANIAKGQARGMASLGDAGEQLINNTFVTFTKLSFYANEPVARAAADVSIAALAGKPQILVKAATKQIEATYEKTKEGYTLLSKTWLYKLTWNESIANTFYEKLWANPEAFKKSNIFKLEYVSVQYNQSLVTFKTGESRTQEQIIDLALVRNVDNAFAELQKDNDVFKTKSPIYSIAPITAKIGMKEGLEGGETFEVLELTYNAKTGLTSYKSLGKLKADNNLVWDNRYNADEKAAQYLDKNGAPLTSGLEGTKFSDSEKVQIGMLIKQIR